MYNFSQYVWLTSWTTCTVLKMETSFRQHHTIHFNFTKLVGNKAKRWMRTCAYQGVRNVCFLDNLACFVFLKHPFWDSLFCFIKDKFTVILCELTVNLFVNLTNDFISLCLKVYVIHVFPILTMAEEEYLNKLWREFLSLWLFVYKLY